MPTDAAAGGQSPEGPKAAGDTCAPIESGPTANRRPGTLLGVSVLWWSIVVSACCLLPLGVVAVLTCLWAIQAADRGDDALADRRWRLARRWVFAAIAVGLVIDVFILAVLLLLGAFGG